MRKNLWLAPAKFEQIPKNVAGIQNVLPESKKLAGETKGPTQKYVASFRKIKPESETIWLVHKIVAANI